jgi:hypothetical protein
MTTTIDWWKQTRDAAEAAAAAGDEGAKAALQIHERLDRIDASVRDIRTTMDAAFFSFETQVADMQSSVQQLRQSRDAKPQRGESQRIGVFDRIVRFLVRK